MRFTNFVTTAVLVPALAVLAFAPAPARAADIYVLSTTNFSGIPTNFGKIDIQSRTYTEIQANLGGASNQAINLAWNPSISAFYTFAGVASNSTLTLRTLTTGGSLSSAIGGNRGALWGMAYRESNSTLYGILNNNDNFVTIDTSTGDFTVLNSDAFGDDDAANPAGGHMAILNDTLYLGGDVYDAGNDENEPKFATLDFSGSSAYQQIVTNNPLFEYMSLASDGTNLYGVYGNGTAGLQTLYQINPADGALTNLGTISGAGLGTRFVGAAIVPVPEPSTYILGALATGVMAAIARRRKAKRNG